MTNKYSDSDNYEIFQNVSSNSDSDTVKRINFNTNTLSDYLTNEAFKTVRTNLLFCGADIKVIVLTSCQANEGKSTVAAGLSKSLSETGKKVLLIDADMRKSVMLKSNIKTRGILGLSEFLSGQASLNDILYQTQNPTFNVIFAGKFPPNPVELLDSKEFTGLMNNLKERYDYIIVDSPPLGPVIDAAVIAKYSDGAILVINNKKINYHFAMDVKNQIEKSGCKILGAILNETDPNRSRYYKKYYGNKNYMYGANK